MIPHHFCSLKNKKEMAKKKKKKHNIILLDKLNTCDKLIWLLTENMNGGAPDGWYK